jgi:ribosomal protein S18 acetylase RimI-like enzyme
VADVLIRSAGQNDLEILWDFLAMAAYEPDATTAKSVPGVAAYLAGWQRVQDFGFIAERDGVIVGAAWARQFSPDEQKTIYGDQRTPKVSIAVRAHARGQGIGEELLRALIAEATQRGLGLCLSVRVDNPARRLYERTGFRDVPDSAVANRTGGISIGMILGDQRIKSERSQGSDAGHG